MRPRVWAASAAAHLKFAHSSMQGTAAYAELLPVVQALGRLKLEIVSAE